MTHVICSLTVKDRDQHWNPTLGNRVCALPVALLTDAETMAFQRKVTSHPDADVVVEVERVVVRLASPCLQSTPRAPHHRQHVRDSTESFLGHCCCCIFLLILRIFLLFIFLFVAIFGLDFSYLGVVIVCAINACCRLQRLRSFTA